MGKKSKSSKAVGKRNNNAILRYWHDNPDLFDTLVDEINPIERFDAGKTWLCIDDDSFNLPAGEVAKRRNIRNHGKLWHCPMCFKDAQLMCSKCKAISYCSKECQQLHWSQASTVIQDMSVSIGDCFVLTLLFPLFISISFRHHNQCHKKACKKNRNRYRFDMNIDQFRSLPKEHFKGHKFIVIKPTEELSSLREICEICLESGDNVLSKVPGFGNDQIQPAWTMTNSDHHTSKAIRKHFGWTSPYYGVDTLEGYRHSVDLIVFMLMYDDNFLNQSDMAPSYYGDACFPHVREGKRVRGNLVIFKLCLRNKKRKESSRDSTMQIACSDDDDLEFEYLLYPITKAEIAHMLQERRNAIKQGKYTRRQWRYEIRKEERRFEITKQGGLNLEF